MGNTTNPLGTQAPPPPCCLILQSGELDCFDLRVSGRWCCMYGSNKQENQWKFLPGAKIAILGGAEVQGES